MNFKQLLKQPLQALPNSLVIAILVVALLGFVDATYLSFEHYQGTIPPCSLTAGCEKVLTSEYSTVFGVPVSLVGVIYYLFILVGAFAYVEGKHEKMLRYGMLITVFAFLASLWFVYLQIFIIESYCLYCLGSAATSTVLFILALIVFKKHQPRQIVSNADF